MILVCLVAGLVAALLRAPTLLRARAAQYMQSRPRDRLVVTFVPSSWLALLSETVSFPGGLAGTCFQPGPQPLCLLALLWAAGNV